MPRVLSPFRQFLDNNGVPLVDGWLRFLVSGQNNTDKDTYADVNETTANANPLQLDASGRMPNVFGSGVYRVVSYTNDPVLNQPSVQVELFDNVGDGNSDGGVPSWDSNSSYDIPDIVVGDDLNYYRSLTNSNEGNDPTIDATNWEQIEWEQFYNANRTYNQGDRVILSGISYQSLQGANLGNTPGSSPDYWGFLIGSPLNSNGHQIQWSKGADVASASALPIISDGNYFDVTGTTSIVSIDTTGRVGSIIKLHFDAALTLTHHATDLILPTEANITTEIGDEAEFVEYAAGDWRCTNYTRLSGSDAGGSAGVGQTWQDVIGSRTAGVEYTNSTNSPIMVSASSDNSAGRISLIIGGVTMAENDSGIADSTSVSGIVPKGTTYQIDVSSKTIAVWAELR